MGSFHKLQFSSLLGLLIAHIYAPWSILIWWNKWGNYYPDLFKLAASCGVLVSATGLFGYLIMLFRTQDKGNPYLHGSARWANEEDIKAAGLIDSDGVYVGAWIDEKGQIRYLRHNDPEHILTYAPTRSGKGVGLVIPTLLSWLDSAVITDLKGELWALTAGWRKKYANNCVLRFEPATKLGSAAWNALDEIRIVTEYEVGDVQNLAILVVDPDGKGLESHWQKTSQPYEHS